MNVQLDSICNLTFNCGSNFVISLDIVLHLRNAVDLLFEIEVSSL